MRLFGWFRKAPTPRCGWCARGFSRNDRDGHITAVGDRHWIQDFDGELRIEVCTTKGPTIASIYPYNYHGAKPTTRAR